MKMKQKLIEINTKIRNTIRNSPRLIKAFTLFAFSVVFAVCYFRMSQSRTVVSLYAAVGWSLLIYKNLAKEDKITRKLLDLTLELEDYLKTRSDSRLASRDQPQSPTIH